MIKFFRKIRQNLLSEGKTGKYLKYAIGEIILVMVGILLALQINNWNEVNKLHKKEITLLNELSSNLKINIKNLENDIKIQTKSIKSFKYILSLPNNRIPYNDSISNYLTDIDYSPDVLLVSSAFHTLKSTGLEIIQSDRLRIAIINLFEVVYPNVFQQTKRLEDQLWPAVVMPLFQKHLRIDNYRWIPNDYDNWLKDKEFFNMISYRETLRNASTFFKKKAIEQTNDVIQLIEKELKKRIK